MIFIAWAIALCMAGLLFWLAFHFWGDTPGGRASIREMILDEEIQESMRREYER